MSELEQNLEFKAHCDAFDRKFGLHHYDMDGNLISMFEWVCDFENGDGRRVGSDQIGPYFISTVLIGIDYNFSTVGPPIIFETSVFHEEIGSEDRWMNRYSTKEEALAGHQQVCEEIRLIESAFGGPNDQ